MYILSVEEMRNIDRRTIQEYGIPGEVLMENAGRAVAEGLDKHKGSVEGTSVLVVCGKGNNGGDGFVAARYLVEMGAKVSLVLCCEEDEVQGDPLIMLQRLPSSVRRISLGQAEQAQFSFAVDGIFGTGFSGRAQGIYAKAIQVINAVADMVVSIDIPSGADGNLGSVNGPCVKADYTFTFCKEKLAHRLYPAKDYCGKVVVCDIGIPEAAVEDEHPLCQLFTRHDGTFFMRQPHPTDHKGTGGRLLIVGGSEGMAGSVVMAAQAAMRSGVGLCYLAVPRCIYQIVAAKVTEVITIPLDDEDGKITPDAAATILEAAGKMDAVVLGCGMGVSKNTEEFVRLVLEQIDTPVLLDADGLNIFARHPKMKRGYSLVLTPHPGEMGRLLDISTDAVISDRIGSAVQCAELYNATAVLKGDGTVTSSGVECYINSTGNPGMATAGSGDVLSGVIGAQLARKIPPYFAAAYGVYIHGKAGDIAAKAKSMTGMIATDIIEALPKCFV